MDANPNRISNLIINAFFVVVCSLIAMPFLLVISISLTSEDSLRQLGYQFIPSEWSLEAYRIVFEKPETLLRGYGVTILLTVLGTVTSLFLTALMAYPISRQDFRYNRPITFYVFFTMLFNVGLIPFYILMTQYLHLKNTLAALIIPAVMSPFNIMIM
ncbi:MAG TPA: carbohydrate ABC transporter permease, partial [Paenibacillus sp.]|nr:carbohydrate ABC transporter permease [Paenibacillus sp.]